MIMHRKVVTLNWSAPASGGWWDLNGTITSCIAAYQPKGAADYAASKVNLTGNATYDAVDGATYPAWNATDGWIFTGNGAAIGQYLDSQVIPTEAMTGIVRFSGVPDPEGSGYYPALFGSFVTNMRFRMLPKSTGNVTYYTHGQNSLSVAGGLSDGVAAITDTEGYYNSIKQGDLPDDWSGTASVTIAIGAQNEETAFKGRLYGNIQAVAFYSESLTGTQIGQLTTAMAAL